MLPPEVLEFFKKQNKTKKIIHKEKCGTVTK